MISGYTRLAAVLASPIAHSVSPLIHNTAFQALEIDAVYLAFDVGPEQLAQALTAVKTLNMLGVNLSMPNKQLGFTLVDEVDEVASLVGAINTVVNQKGKLVGYNTDGAGFMASLAAEGVALLGKKMTILGAGGASLAIIAQAALDGVKEIVVFKRQAADYQSFKQRLALISQRTGGLIELIPLEDQERLERELATSDLLVNTTSVGMTPDEGQSLITQGEWLPVNLVVADIIYQPRETALLALARQQGCQTVNGLGMLLHQAAYAFELWTGQKMPLKKVRSVIV